MEQRLVPAAIADAGTSFCAQDWNELLARNPAAADDPYLPRYCYTAAHIVTLLTDGFGFPHVGDRITAPRRVQGTSVGWALGALLYELAGSSG